MPARPVGRDLSLVITIAARHPKMTKIQRDTEFLTMSSDE